jgi:hypothetical protein
MPKRDFSQVAKAIIDKVTGNALPKKPDTRNPHAVALSKLAASKGGLAGKKALSANRRKEIAQKAIAARWKK